MTKYIKTEAGQRAFKERSSILSAKQRAAFILIDGQRTVEQVIGATGGMGITMADFEHMVAAGFLSQVVDPVPARDKAPAVADIPLGTAQPTDGTALSAPDLYQRAYPLATQITASLGLRGFMLNVAVEKASGYDELLALLPKIQAAAGNEKCLPLARALAQ
jgi:hypothetical protein